MISPETRRTDRRTLLGRSAGIAALAALASRMSLSPAVATAQDDDTASLVSGSTAFALDLYHALRQGTGENLLASPLSVSLALAMTYAGARGDTASQMADVLGFTLPDAALHETFGALAADLTERGNVEANEREGTAESGLRIANALWGEQTYPFNPAFADQLAADYGAGLEQTDFINAPEQARDDINAWVEEQTEDRIQDIVPEGVITAATRLVLANAIYFYGAWQHTFDEDNTADDTFHLLDGDTVDVPFMVQTETFGYASGEGMQAIDLPYASDGFSMTIILPDDGQFETIEQGLDPATLQELIDALEWTEVVLHLPTFEFEFAASLAGTLQTLGMADAFDPDRADFTGMVDEDAGEGTGEPERLVISDVLHKAFISVDEEGTEAAAATAVIVGVTSAPPPEEEPLELRIDRPFLFTIRDTATGTILFLGRVTNPSR